MSDEILNQNVQPFPGAPFTVPTYRNADRTRHYGVEAGLGVTVPGALVAHRGGDNAAGRYLEPADGRAWYIGTRLTP